MSLSVVWLEVQRPAVMVDRLGQITLRLEDIGQIIVGFGKIRHQNENLPVAAHRRAQRALSSPYFPQIVMKVGLLGVKGDGPLKMLDRLGLSPLPTTDQTQ